ncbi:MAG TPA: EF-hand domain-containing protein [Woeseiaceae bacterium]|nr:EF-hand domain-containing protein [Woeseiaceae bacterium]
MIRPVVFLAGFLSYLMIAGCTVLQGPFDVQSPPEDLGMELCRQSVFKQTDVNSDGVLDPAETAATPMSVSSTFFNRIDENQDGVIDRQEYEKMGLFVQCELCPTVVDCPLGRSGKTGNGSTTP